MEGKYEGAIGIDLGMQCPLFGLGGQVSMADHLFHMGSGTTYSCVAIYEGNGVEISSSHLLSFLSCFIYRSTNLST
jgi:hypothetical protein